MMTLEEVITATKAKRVNGGFLGTCPIHNDTTASLSIKAGDKQPIVVNCLAGCDWKDVRNALGISRSTNGNGTAPDELHYDYRDLSEKVRYQIVRKPPKIFSIRRPDNNGSWIYGQGDVERIPYDLPELSEAISLGKAVYVPEGEKDCESLKSVGLTATTNSGGAGWKWTPEFAEYFRGAVVRVIPDNDDAGRAHAADVIEKLTGVAESVTLIELPGVREKGDVTDWLMMGGTVEQLENLGATVPALASDTPKDAPVFLSLSVLMERPELLVPPQYTIPRLSTRGRATLLVGPDKSGKSTVLAHAASETSKRGQFLGEAIDASGNGRVIWGGLEEALGDAVRRFNDLGAVPDNIQLVVLQSDKLLDHIRQLAGDWNADVLCLDSLTEYARVVRGTVPEDGDSSGWAGVIRPLVALTREFPNLSAIFTHHPRRTDGQYRGSGEIAAAVDCLLEMRNPTPTEDPNLRHITGRARWPVESFDIAFADGRYELAGGAQLSVDARTLIHVEQNRGISQAGLRERVGGRAKDVDLAIIRLIQRGVIRDLGMGGKHAYHPAAPAPLQGDFEDVK